MYWHAGQDLAGKQDSGQLLQRLKAFAEVALVPHRSGTPHMRALISKLQDTLASVERFPVQCSNLGPSLSSSLRAFGTSSGAPGLLPVCRTPLITFRLFSGGPSARRHPWRGTASGC